MRITTVFTALLVSALIGSPASGGEKSMLAKPKLGEFWYRMDDAVGNPQGYARLVLGEREGGGLTVAWELKLAFPGGTYEEDRSMALDADHRMLRADYSVSGKLLSSVERRDGRIVGTAEGEEVDLAVPDDACAGMLFVFAAMLPADADSTFARTALNEAQTFRITGAEVFVRAGAEDGLVRFELRKVGGVTLPIWVNDEREIAKVDWGGGNLMTLAAESTAHLFDPEPPAVVEVESGKDRLVMTGDFEALAPEEFFDHFTKPDLLTKWWPETAEVELETGGAYRLSWPGANWNLLGEVVSFERGKRFEFTWKWAHTPEGTPVRTVLIELAPLGEKGTKLVLTHSPYGESEAEQQARAAVKQGWESFLSRLRSLR